MISSAAILCVGSELVRGKTVNTNSTWISRRLEDMGIDTLFHISVPDHDDHIQNTLDFVINEANIIIITGGLGPTDDDLTKESVASYFQLDLVENSQAKNAIIERYKKLDREMPLSNLKQALFPENAHILPNSLGSAPGCLFQVYDRIICLLPGPPSEMKPMFENSLLPILSGITEGNIETAYVKVFGLGESKAEEMISHIIRDESTPEIGTYFGENELLITVRSKEQKNNVKETQEAIFDRLSPYAFAKEDKSLTDVFVETLKSKNLKIAVAESCSGGLLTSLISKIPGASQILETGVVTYSNKSKHLLLNVENQLIEEKGAVSEEVAKAMVKGLADRFHTDICISITGLAGPEGGSDEKPVGTVYIGYYIKNKDSDPKIYVKKYGFFGDRIRIQTLSVKNAMLEVLSNV